MAASKRLKILCCREFQNSIRESVHSLLAAQIEQLGLAGHYDIQRATISGRNGSVFLFAGLKHNPTSIKSLEAADIAWVEEAQTISKASWDILTPTLRKDGAEIWASFNPVSRHDEIYQRFVANPPPPDSIVIRLRWQDNPWWNEALEAERQAAQKRDPIGYRNIWEGEVRHVTEGAIYGDEIDTMYREGRVLSLVPDPVLPVHTAWDIGMLSSTAIWFAQISRGGEIRLIDYYEGEGQGLPHYVNILKNKGYTYGDHFAPHDINVREWGADKSRLSTAHQLGIRFSPIPAQSLDDGIHAVRVTFPALLVDPVKCKVGLERLSSYVRAYNSAMQEYTDRPQAGIATHGSDALRYMILGLRPPHEHTKRGHRPVADWMA
jgi:phage terminase large subunit